MELSTFKILEENLVQSDFQQSLGDEFTFQQDNNIKHKAKSITGVAYQEDSECSWVAELNLLENQWQDLKMVV